MSGTPEALTLELPESLLEELVERVLERLSAQTKWRDLERTAEAFGVPVRQVRLWREKGCPARKIGRRLMFDLAAVEAWLESR